jgi:predicted pyridoxine 5'-phosphate oxidase superfamily flavin-nucleotide-binding protein
MNAGFHDGSRELQDRFDTRMLADRIDSLLVRDTIDDGDRAFIAERDMLFLATADAQGRPTCSYKGGEPGFVRVLDERTVAFPNYDGNGMYLSMGNALVNPHVGLLFIDFEHGNRMRLEGEASIDLDDPLTQDYHEAQFVVRVRVRAVFPNCPRYIHRYQLVRRSSFVPQVEHPTPVPDWKRSDWAYDALPANDPARHPGAGAGADPPPPRHRRAPRRVNANGPPRAGRGERRGGAVRPCLPPPGSGTSGRGRGKRPTARR